LLTGETIAAGPQCTSPYVQVQGPAAAFFPDPTNQMSIQYVAIGEPFINCSTNKIRFVLKVPTMDPQNNGTVRPLPNGRWQVNFFLPASMASDGRARTMSLGWDATGTRANNNGTTGFSIGYALADGSGGTYFTNPAVSGNVLPNGTINIDLNIGSTINFTAITGCTACTAWSIEPEVWQGKTLTQIQGVTTIVITPGVVIEDSSDGVDAQTTGDGVYTVQGNLSCSAAPVAALAANPTSGNAPLTVSFDASTSNIPAGGCGTVASYIFDFGDGQQVTRDVATFGAAAAMVSHTYTTQGTKQARVRITSTSGLTSGNVAQQNITVNAAGPPVVSSVVSRKTHGGGGDFDIVLPQPPAARAVECRSGGANNDYTLVFTFLNNVASVSSASITAGAGSVNGAFTGPNSNQYTVNLTGVTSGQSTTVTLNNVSDSTGATGAVPAIIGVLVGDTTNDAVTNSTDISQTKSKSGASVDTSNFRNDVTVDGNLNSTDISLVKSKSGTALIP
jgi:PKD repeat protein